MKESVSVIIAEMGVDMDPFPTEGHLSSWAGMSPGSNESAGKKKTEFAWIASKMKGTYLWAIYQSVVGRRGKKKTLVAGGHKILIMCYHMLKYKVPYRELGSNYLDVRKKDRIANSYIKRLTNLGYAVTLKEVA
jgi:transposase